MEGPTIKTTETLKCSFCYHFQSRLWKSGRNPNYESRCKHPKAKDLSGYGDGFIRRSGADKIDDTPPWCPLKPQEAKPMKTYWSHDEFELGELGDIVINVGLQEWFLIEQYMRIECRYMWE